MWRLATTRVTQTAGTMTIRRRRGGGGGRHCRALQSSSTRYVSSSNYGSSSSSTDVVHVTIQEAKQQTTKALQQIGWDSHDAELQAEIMTQAEVCGNNQGLVKMYHPSLMAPPPADTVNRTNKNKPTLEHDTLTSAVVNGHQAPGMLAASMAADTVIDKLNNNNNNNNNNKQEHKEPTNIVIVASYNTSTSSGRLAYYVERIAKAGFVGIAMCNSPEFVAAAQGGKPVFGTNPLAIGIPKVDKETGELSEFPFTFDMATSAIALFGVLSSKAKGEALPHNVAFGRDGSWTTDASEALDGGAIATFGGHKGAGLSLCIELLAGALSGGAVLGQVESKKVAKNWGHLFIGIRPSALTDDYENKVTSVIETVKASGDDIRIPGERSAMLAQENLKKGTIPIPVKIWEQILHTAQHGLDE